MIYADNTISKLSGDQTAKTQLEMNALKETDGVWYASLRILSHTKIIISTNMDTDLG